MILMGGSQLGETLAPVLGLLGGAIAFFAAFGWKRRLYLGGKYGAIPDSARPLPNWTSRWFFLVLGFFFLASGFSGFLVKWIPLSLLPEGFFYLLLLVLSCGGFYIAVTRGATFLGVWSESSRMQSLTNRIVAFLLAGLGLLLSIHGLLRVFL
jgi:hypothetical protein